VSAPWREFARRIRHGGNGREKRHQKKSGRRVQVTVEALAPLNRRRRALLDAEVDRVAAILGGTASLTLGDVTVGAHA